MLRDLMLTEEIKSLSLINEVPKNIPFSIENAFDILESNDYDNDTKLFIKTLLLLNLRRDYRRGLNIYDRVLLEAKNNYYLVYNKIKSELESAGIDSGKILNKYFGARHGYITNKNIEEYYKMIGRNYSSQRDKEKYERYKFILASHVGLDKVLLLEEQLAKYEKATSMYEGEMQSVSTNDVRYREFYKENKEKYTDYDFKSPEMALEYISNGNGPYKYYAILELCNRYIDLITHGTNISYNYEKLVDCFNKYNDNNYDNKRVMRILKDKINDELPEVMKKLVLSDSYQDYIPLLRLLVNNEDINLDYYFIKNYNNERFTDEEKIEQLKILCSKSSFKEKDSNIRFLIPELKKYGMNNELYDLLINIEDSYIYYDELLALSNYYHEKNDIVKEELINSKIRARGDYNYLKKSFELKNSYVERDIEKYINAFYDLCNMGYAKNAAYMIYEERKTKHEMNQKVFDFIYDKEYKHTYGLYMIYKINELEGKGIDTFKRKLTEAIREQSLNINYLVNNVDSIGDPEFAKYILEEFNNDDLHYLYNRMLPGKYDYDSERFYIDKIQIGIYAKEKGFVNNNLYDLLDRIDKGNINIEYPEELYYLGESALYFGADTSCLENVFEHVLEISDDKVLKEKSTRKLIEIALHNKNEELFKKYIDTFKDFNEYDANKALKIYNYLNGNEIDQSDNYFDKQLANYSMEDAISHIKDEHTSLSSNSNGFNMKRGKSVEEIYNSYRNKIANNDNCYYYYDMLDHYIFYDPHCGYTYNGKAGKIELSNYVEVTVLPKREENELPKIITAFPTSRHKLNPILGNELSDEKGKVR